MKFKKVVAVLMAATMVFGIAACGSKPKEDANAGDGEKDVKTQEQDNEPAEDNVGDESGEAPKGNGEFVYKEAELTMSVDADETLDGIEAVCAKAEELLGIKVNIEIRPAGLEGESLIRTRLASGDMTDLVIAGGGTQLELIDASKYYISLNDTDIPDKIDDIVRNEMTASDGNMYGIPIGTSMSACILYNREMYDKYNLEIPKTWDDFLENCRILKEAGETAIIGTYADNWTAQVPLLADWYNVNLAEPDFVEKFTAGEAKFATSEAAVKTWNKFGDLIEFYNDDYMAATYDDGCAMIAEGEGAHWFMLTQALSNIYSLYDKETVDNIGIFAMPDEDPDKTGLIVMGCNGLFGNKNTGKTEDIMRFIEFYISETGLDAYCEAQLPDGPALVKGYQPPEGAYRAVAEDMMVYFDEGRTTPNMELVLPVKGSNCPAICVEAASGQVDGKTAAAKYDADCYKIAVQIGLGWDE